MIIKTQLWHSAELNIVVPTFFVNNDNNKNNNAFKKLQASLSYIAR